VVGKDSTLVPNDKRIANQENVPEEIVYLAMIESGLNPTIVSRAQAVGMWQFMRSTGEMYGLKANRSPWIDERTDPNKATTAAMKHLRDLYYMFGDWYIAFAAYNCGAGCVQRAKNKTKIEKPTFWDLYKNLPRETRNYVPLYIATAKIASSPSTYGIKLSELEFQKEFKYDTFTLNEPVSIEALANSAGITVQEFQQLNTELLKMTTPPDITEYTIRLPQGRLNEFAANFSKLTDEEKKPWITHIVQKRESLKSIANKYGITTNDLAAANGISSRSKIKTGTKLQIPLEKQPSAEENSIAKNNNAPLQQNVSNEKKEEYKTYSVQKGENTLLYCK
jgi:membrane-bound lytic murein transglycosylase D